MVWINAHEGWWFRHRSASGPKFFTKYRFSFFFFVSCFWKKYFQNFHMASCLGGRSCKYGWIQLLKKENGEFYTEEVKPVENPGVHHRPQCNMVSSDTEQVSNRVQKNKNKKTYTSLQSSKEWRQVRYKVIEHKKKIIITTIQKQ